MAATSSLTNKTAFELEVFLTRQVNSVNGVENVFAILG